MRLCRCAEGTLLCATVSLCLFWLLYLLWLFPEILGLAPTCYWGLVPPGLLVWIVCTYGLTYGALAMALNPPLDTLGALWDAHSARPCVAPAGRDCATPALGDIPLTLVNKAQMLQLQRGQPAQHTR